MKYILFLVLFLGCAAEYESVGPKEKLSGCTVEKVKNGIILTCGNDTTLIPNGTDGIDGEDGTDGKDGSGVILTKMNLSTINDCAYLDTGIWVKNESNKFDVYNNNKCKDNPAPHRALCNNIPEHQVCWVDNMQLSINGINTDMVLHIVEFN